MFRPLHHLSLRRCAAAIAHRCDAAVMVFGTRLTGWSGPPSATTSGVRTACSTSGLSSPRPSVAASGVLHPQRHLRAACTELLPASLRTPSSAACHLPLSHSTRRGHPAFRQLSAPCSASMSSSAAQGVSSTVTAEADRTVAKQEGLEQPPPHLSRMGSKFCRLCGSPMCLRVPAGEKEWRHVCSSEAACGAIEYYNPKMVVGCIVEHEGKVLLCRRAIEPCKGMWTVPAGYMELRESSAEGAARETREEANAEVAGLLPYAHWDIPSIGQAYILFRGQLAAPFTFSPGVESLETNLFAPADIPFDELAFSSVSITLKYFLEDAASGRYRIHHGVIQKEPGAASNDPATFAVRDHHAMYVSSS